MFDSITKVFSKVFGTKSERDIKEITPYLKATLAEYDKLTSISDDELRNKTQEFIEYIEEQLKPIDDEIASLQAQVDENPSMTLGEKDKVFKEIDNLNEDRNSNLEDILLDILPKAFAVIKETAKRLTENKQLVVTASLWDEQVAAKHDHVVIENGKATWKNKWMAAGNETEWNMLHYDVQIIGGIVLHQGKIAEMQTGEGKTLVATLPAYLNALAKRGVHIVTVNNYLAIRDSEWMGPIFEFHKLKTDCIDKHQPHSEERIAAYNADIIYGTNNEFGFDYLRDNMVREKGEIVQRKHHYAMVDEVDSVLIDDARTPLIISGPVPEGDQQDFFELKPRVYKIVEEQRRMAQNYLNEAKKLIKEGNEADGGVALFRAYKGFPKYKPLIKFLSQPGMKQILLKTESYYMADNNKLMPEAEKPLLFKIEEKQNSVDLTDKGLNAITGSEEKDFFVLPDIGVDIDKIEKDENLTDTEKIEAKDKLITDFSVKSQRIHTVQQLLKAYSLFEKDVDYVIMDDSVKIVDEQTGRIMEGRRYSDGLHQALEAKENVKIQAATQTYATVTLQNYFRMYHKLSGMTGTAETEAGEFWEIYKLDVVAIPTNRPIQRDDRDDLVYKTVREKFNAIAEEIQKLVEQGRPVLVGTTSVENSELISRMLNIRKIPHQVLNAKQHAKEADVVAQAGFPGTVTIATNMAGRGTDIKLSQEVKESGGLAIIGTERHESRRVDRQLRGRAGRQGDPGSSQFFVSLEDNLMRLFGSERIARVMDRMGLEEGEVIQHSMISKSIERAQRKVEENNFGIRKRLLEYDNVMNYQREVIYKRRRNALYGERLQLDVMNSFFDTAYHVSETHAGNYEGFRLDALKIFGVDTKISDDDFHKHNDETVGSTLYKEAMERYATKNTGIISRALPVFKQIKDERGEVVKNIVVPITDGRKMMNATVNLDDAIQSDGKEITKILEQNITLAIIDQEWKEHLREMDELKQQVQNAVHEQKDPLLIYKFESFELFKTFMANVNEEVVSFLAKSNIAVQEEAPQAAAPKRRSAPKVQAQKAEAASALATNRPQTHQDRTEASPIDHKPRKSDKVYSRNDRVTVKYNDGTTKKDVKFKTVEQDVKANKCVII